MIKGLGSAFSISVNVYVPSTTDISGNGNFIWCFSYSSDRGYLFLNAKDTRYAITNRTYSQEQGVNPAQSLTKDKWVNITYVQDGATGTVYVNNVQKAQNTSMTLFPSGIERSLDNNYLGRSCYSGDAYLKDALYSDFRVYNKCLSESERAGLVNAVTAMYALNDADAIAYDIANIFVPKAAYKAITLPTEGEYGTQISWQSSDLSHLTNSGVVVRQETDRDVDVTMTATFTLGSFTETRQYTVTVKQKENYSHYLFAFFPSNDDENIYFAVGEDGYNYTTINNDQAVFLAEGHTVMGGLRDPHILRGEDGNFYMVATDMRSALGWSSNRGMVLMKSPDLINWTSSTVHFPTKYEGTYLANVTHVWAPQTIYEKEAGKYMVYFSILTNDGTVEYDKDFYCYANADFTDLEGEPVYLFDRGSATIDMDIVYNEADGLYHGFYKNEGSGGICKVTATSLTAPSGQEGKQWSLPSGTLQQTDEAVEGAGVFRLINDDNWILMYDCYANGHYQFCSSPDLSTFTFVKNTATSGSFTPRHGTVLPITEDEYRALLTAFPADEITGEVTPDGDGNYNLTQERISHLCEATTHWSTLDGFVIHTDNRSYTNDDASIRGTWTERWASNASIGANSASKQLRYLPAGQYKLQASLIATWQSDASVTVSGVTLFADDQTAAVHTANGVPELYTLNFDIASTDNYTTTLGLETSSNTNANWVSIDNMRLYYVGTQAEYETALRAMQLDYIAQAEALYDDLCDDYKAPLQTAVAAVDPDATNIDDVTTQLDNLCAAMQTAREHIAQTVTMGDTDTSAPASASDCHIHFKREAGFAANDQWSTLCLPFSLTALQVTETFGSGTQLKFLAAASESGNSVNMTFQESSIIQANTPYIIKPTTFRTLYTIDGVDVSPTSDPRTTIPGIVGFVGTYTTPTQLSTNQYYIKSNKIYQSTGNTKMKAYRAFFELLSVGGEVKQLIFSTDDNAAPVGIDSVLPQAASSSLRQDGEVQFNLSGQPVNSDYRGITVKKGHKTLKMK